MPISIIRLATAALVLAMLGTTLGCGRIALKDDPAIAMDVSDELDQISDYLIHLTAAVLKYVVSSYETQDLRDKLSIEVTDLRRTILAMEEDLKGNQTSAMDVLPSSNWLGNCVGSDRRHHLQVAPTGALVALA